MRILLPIIGLVLVACGARALWRTRTRTALWYALCWTATCPALSLWPVQNSVLVDNALRAPGVGRFLDVIFTWIAQSCMFLFTLSFTNGWRRGSRVALAAFGLVLIAECVVWPLMARSEGAHLSHVIYDGFFGSPSLVLTWNLVYGFSIGFGFALGAAGYLHILRTAHDLHSRVNSWAAFLVTGDGMLYGLLVMAQAVASRLGLGATSVQGLMPILMLAGALPMVGFTWAAIYGRPLWHYLSRLFSLQHREHDLRRVLKDLLGANVFLSDRLVQLHPYADSAVVQAVGDGCTKRLIPRYQRQVAMEATRWLTLSRANAGEPAGGRAAASHRRKPWPMYCNEPRVRAISMRMSFVSWRWCLAPTGFLNWNRTGGDPVGEGT